jgi:hypothetical protein
MAKFTKSIKVGLTPELLEKTRTAAQQKGDSISGLIRTALEKYLTKATSLLDTPLVEWTPAEKEYADKMIQDHFDEDRNEHRYACWRTK